MEFNKLRLTGFKSFADPTELVIQQGLTGIVGPNGCGKSNLLEALRWVMGESSYKNMRATGMEDVIFAGSANRPGRNMAEVVVVLDNAKRTAPAAFNDADILEISRRIEHEAGSAYRINGKDARARDVQLLFADASTGARSPALVRQGQISEIISAKPAARRRILEEAAGITGLHTRRHEAQLRLNAAETNLTRLEDVTGQLETQLAGLKRQARQANRYKKISGEIRKAESILLYLRWAEAAKSAKEAQGELEDQRRILGTRTQAASQALRAQSEAADGLPELREKETIAAAVLQRLNVERDSLELEEKRAQQRRDELQTRLNQTNHDLTRERELIRDTAEILEKLTVEERGLHSSDAGSEDAATEAQDKLAIVTAALKESEAALDEASQSMAQLKARQTSLERTVNEQTARTERLKAQLSDVDQELASKTQDQQSVGDTQANDRFQQAEADVAHADASVLEAEQALIETREKESVARDDFEEKQRAAQQLHTEIRTLSKLLDVNENDLWPPVIDALNVTAGWEVALGAALGEDLNVPLDDAAPVHWDRLADYSEPAQLPGGVVALSEYVQAPPALQRRLQHIGIVSQAEGKSLQADLKPGQRLVSSEGDLWRWDGYTAAADAPTAAARRLAERNRLGELETQAQVANDAAQASQLVFETIHAGVQDAQTHEQEQRILWRKAHDALGTARDQQVQLERALSERAARIAALKEAQTRLGTELGEAENNFQSAKQELETLNISAPVDIDLEQLRQNVEEHRAGASQARAAYDGLARETEMRQTRLAAIESERTSWQTRAQNAQAQISTLQDRVETLDQERENLQRLPDELAEKHKRLLDALGDAEGARKLAADRLAEAETKLNELTKTARAREEELTETREAVARVDALLEAARARETDFAANISETLDLKPEDVPQSAEFDASGDLPSSEDTEARLDKWRAERERLGAVNLRAEEETVELTEQLDSLIHERDDLIKAIARLRQGINSLNHEGRGRLLAAFDKVNENFQQLFTTLFGGGEAKLELIEADDPLEAGLEIFARPPGKRRQPLSLLSGGEQALTAMSLIFAVFLTNPSPICVLDEVDAPLDDANVQRFCNLMDEMTKTTDTRYLVITHHPLTMSRMNRLFGVTMGERGVSQLVSVDLETAEQFRETG